MRPFTKEREQQQQGQRQTQEQGIASVAATVNHQGWPCVIHGGEFKSFGGVGGFSTPATATLYHSPNPGRAHFQMPDNHSLTTTWDHSLLE